MMTRREAKAETLGHSLKHLVATGSLDGCVPFLKGTSSLCFFHIHHREVTIVHWFQVGKSDTSHQSCLSFQVSSPAC